MTITAARLQVVVDANLTGLTAGMAAANAETKTFVASAAAVHGGALLALGTIAALGVAAGVAASQAGNFQAQLTRLVTDAGESAANLDLVRQGMLKLAVDTGTSTDALTAGMYTVESGGYHGAKALDVLTAAAKGAKVGFADVNTVGNATTTLLNDFAGQAGTATQVVNALIATVSHGKTTLEDLSGSLAMVAPAAASAHVKMNDMLAAMATMTGEGIPAAEAATYLRQTIIALSAPADESKKALADIGLTTQQVSDAMHNSLPDALKLIYSHLNHFYKEGSPEYVAAVKAISGGMRQMMGMLALGGDHLGTFGDNLKTITAQVKSGGNEIENWGTVQDNFNFKMSKAGAALQVLAITVGSHLLPALGKIVSAITPGISKMAEWITAITSNHDLMQKLAPVLGIVAGVIGGVLVAALVSLAITAWAALAPFLVFAAPFIAVGAAIAALVIGFKLLYEHWAPFRAFVDTMRAGLVLMVAIIASFVSWIKDKLGQAFAAILPHLLPVQRAFAQLGAEIGERLQPILKFLQPLIVWLQQNWPLVAAAVLPVIGVIALVAQHWKEVSGVLMVGLGVLAGVWNAIWPGMAQALTGVWDVIRGYIQVVWSIISGIILVGLDLLGGNWGKAWADLGDMVRGVWDGIRTMIRGTINMLIGDLNAFIGFLNKLQIHIPAIGVGPVHSPAFDWDGLHLPSIPHLAVGGFVTGSGLAVIHKGETVIPAASTQPLPNPQSRALAQGGAAREPSVVQLIVDGRKLAEVVVRHQPGVIRQAIGVRSM